MPDPTSSHLDLHKGFEDRFIIVPRVPLPVHCKKPHDDGLTLRPGQDVPSFSCSIQFAGPLSLGIPDNNVLLDAYLVTCLQTASILLDWIFRDKFGFLHAQQKPN